MTVVYDKGSYNADSKYVTEEITIGEGATLKVWKDYIQVMSDVWEMTTYAMYWDEVAKRLVNVPYVKKANVDATPAVLEAVKASLYAQAFEEAMELAEAEAAKIKKDDIVKVVSGKTAKGLTGKVVVQIERPYKMGWKSVMATKLGIATSDEKINVRAANGKVYENYKDVTWVWAKNCELIQIPNIDIMEVREKAKYVTENKFCSIYKAS